MMANTVEDPNHDPNLYSEIDISSCDEGESLRVPNMNVPANNFTLKDNYPNPFNPLTTISYNLPKDSFVSITIYDMLGNVVNNLVNTKQSSEYKSVKVVIPYHCVSFIILWR